MLGVLAPEMDAIADELFAMVKAAGLRVGMTLRPQILTPTPGWNTSVPPNRAPQPYYQRDLFRPDNSSDVQAYAANIVRKASYAITRWHCDMFYVDSTANRADDPLPFEIWDLVSAALPNTVFFPEETSINDFATVAPLQNDWSDAAIGVNPAAKLIWPGAYNFQLLQNDINLTKTPIDEWVSLVREGDILSVSAWYADDQTTIIKQIYEMAAAETLAPGPRALLAPPSE